MYILKRRRRSVEKLTFLNMSYDNNKKKSAQEKKRENKQFSRLTIVSLFVTLIKHTQEEDAR